MSKLSKRTREGLLKTFAVLTAVTTIMSLSGFMYLAPNWASAAVPSDYGLVEGNTISAAGSDDPDVYIVNDWGYKRLFLSPQIFNLYGHLGSFANVKSVSAATRDAFPTSGLFRVDGDEKVYGIETTGEDVASLHWVNTSGSQAVADDPNFFKKVFVINAAEFALYSVASEYSSVNQVPAYTRGGSVSSPTPVAGNVSVSLASSNPSAQTVTQGSYGVNAMVMRFSGTGTVNELSFKRGGAGATTDYDNLYIYDGARRLTAGRTLSSSEGTVTFISLNVAVSGTKDLTLVGDHSSTAGAGNVNNFSLTNVKIASGTVSGYPVVSNNFSLAGLVEPMWSGCISSSDPDSKKWFEKNRLSLFSWSSQARGFFSGRADPLDKSDAELVRCWYCDDNFKKLERAKELAKKKGVAPITIAGAYVLTQKFPTYAIIGPRNLSEMAGTMDALSLELTVDEVNWLNLEK